MCDIQNSVDIFAWTQKDVHDILLHVTVSGFCMIPFLARYGVGRGEK